MCRAINRIPKWANSPNQCNHKIVRAFLLLENNGQVDIDTLQQRCSNREVHADTFVQKFRGHYASLKTEGGNSHGKVFIEKNGIVKIWEPIKDALNLYRSSFIR